MDGPLYEAPSILSGVSKETRLRCLDAFPPLYLSHQLARGLEGLAHGLRTCPPALQTAGLTVHLAREELFATGCCGRWRERSKKSACWGLTAGRPFRIFAIPRTTRTGQSRWQPEGLDNRTRPTYDDKPDTGRGSLKTGSRLSTDLRHMTSGSFDGNPANTQTLSEETVASYGAAFTNFNWRV